MNWIYGVKNLKVKNLFKLIEDQLIKMIMESQDVLAGNIYKSINAAKRIAEGLPELKWFVENRIPKTYLKIIGANQKLVRVDYLLVLDDIC